MVKMFCKLIVKGLSILTNSGARPDNICNIVKGLVSNKYKEINAMINFVKATSSTILLFRIMAVFVLHLLLKLREEEIFSVL